jgi:hypothetical protein
MKNGKWYLVLNTCMLFGVLITMLFISCAGQPDENNHDYNNILGHFPEYTPDSSDDTPPTIKGSIPPHEAENLTTTLAIVLFFDDEINPNTINGETVKVYKTNFLPENKVLGEYGAILSEAGNTILFFVPDQPLPEKENIYIKLPAAGVRDDGENYIGSEEIIQFSTGEAIATVETNLGFEEGDNGYRFIGDGAIIGTEGELSPSGGAKMAAISSGNYILSPYHAIDYTTSVLATGTIAVPTGASKLIFDYDFLSEEFDEWVDEDLDDTFIISITGSTSLYATLVTSVNIIGQDDSRSIPVSNTGSLSVVDADHTGWIAKEIDISDMGSEINMFFTVSDVGDSSYDTLVFIDRLRFE